VIFFRALVCFVLGLLYRISLHREVTPLLSPTLFKDANNNPCLKMDLKEDAGNFYFKDVGIFSAPQK
jgi:hypothetical protein